MTPDRIDILFAAREVTAAHLAEAEHTYRTAVTDLATAIRQLDQARRTADTAQRRYTQAADQQGTHP